MNAPSSSHDQRALEVAIRRFPYFIAVCRHYQSTTGHLPAVVLRDRAPDIIAEYRRVVGRSLQ